MNWQQLNELFQTEAIEHLDKLNQVLLQVEINAGDEMDAEGIRELFRAAHSLKGAARTVNQRSIEQVAHALEAVFQAVRDSELVLNSDVADVAYDGLDSIRLLLDGNTESLDLDRMLARLHGLVGESAVSSPQSEPLIVDLEEPASPVSPEPSVHSDEIIRVPVSRLDALMMQASNLLVSSMNIEQRAQDLKALRDSHRAWQKQWRRVHRDYIRLIRAITQQPDLMGEWQPMLDFLLETQRYMRVVGRELVVAEQALQEDSLSLEITAEALQRAVRDVRLLPFETIAGGLQRTVRDVARYLDKDVLFQTVGTRIELDKQVLENIKDPLMHLLRNAIDHGIEPRDIRLARGKPPQGLILLTLLQRGNKVHIMVTDDGYGIDALRVREAAIDSGLLTPAESESLNETEIYELLMQSGMTTRRDVNEISGRGVGLDVVRQKVEVLQGQIRVESQIGHGTTFEIILPVSLSTLHCVLVQIGPETYAIPTSVVVRILDYDIEALFTVKGKPMLTLDDQPIPLAYLSDVLDRSHYQPMVNGNALVLVLEALERRYAFVVDDIIAEQEVMVRSLNPEMARIRNVSGATLLANGEVVIILNVSDLIKSAQGKPVRRREVVPPEPILVQASRILVVDDSITTRTLQRNILEAAGYEVVIATHGVDALDILDTQSVDLVISDIEMPWMDGFELTTRIRQQSTLKNMPVILVTSLDAAEHRDRGFEVGADAYIAKGVFDQNELLSTIQTLL